VPCSPEGDIRNNKGRAAFSVQADDGLNMTWKIETGIAAVALGVAVLWATQAEPVLKEHVPKRLDHFSHADYLSFDRDFTSDGRHCDVGLRRKGICFGASPFEQALKPGADVPARLPDMPAEFSIILNTDLKAETLETWRVGRSLLLVRRGTRKIVDVMPLGLPYRTGNVSVLAYTDVGADAR
jgi:hypothetical protein